MELMQNSHRSSLVKVESLYQGFGFCRNLFSRQRRQTVIEGPPSPPSGPALYAQRQVIKEVPWGSSL